MTMTTEELIRQLKTKDLAVFGTGFVAEMFYQALDLHGLTSGIHFFAISNAQEGQQFHGKPVYSLEEAPFSENTLLCLAVHGSAAKDLQKQMENCPGKRVWVYPNLYGLLYGDPIQTDKTLALAKLLSQQNQEEYWLAVRYAAIRDYLRRTDAYPQTRELYLRALSLHCGTETAVRRCGQMEELALSMKEEGFRRECHVLIDEAGRIIDGLHRVACAAYLQLESVPVVIYRSSPVYDRLLTERNRLPEYVLQDAGFSAEDMSFIRKARDELFDR